MLSVCEIGHNAYSICCENFSLLYLKHSKRKVSGNLLRMALSILGCLHYNTLYIVFIYSTILFLHFAYCDDVIHMTDAVLNTLTTIIQWAKFMLFCSAVRRLQLHDTYVSQATFYRKLCLPDAPLESLWLLTYFYMIAISLMKQKTS